MSMLRISQNSLHDCTCVYISIVLFKHGAFDSAAATATADALRAFATGLPAYVLVKILAPGFFAREDTTTPVIIGAAAMILNVALSLWLITFMDHVGIALATSLSSWFNAAALWFFLKKRNQFSIDHRLQIRLPKIVMASIIMGGIVWLVLNYVGPHITGQSLKSILYLALLIVLGTVSYGFFAQITGASSVGELKSLLRRGSTGKQ